MKRIGIVLVVFCCLISGCNNRALIPFEHDGLSGYKDERGKVVIQPQYIFAEDFSKYGIAAVCDLKPNWIYIDTRGKFVIKPMFYDNGYDPFTEGLARYEENRKIGFFNEKGDKVIPAKFEFAFPFQNGFSLVAKGVKRVKDGEHTLIQADKWGFIDKKGKLTIPFKFDDFLSPFEEPVVARMVIDGKEVWINRKGEIVDK